MSEKIIKRIFIVLVFLVLLVPWFVSKDLMFPFITPKAFFFRIFIQLALPFYLYFVLKYSEFRPKNNIFNWLMGGFFLVNLISVFTGLNAEKSFWGNFERMGGVYYLLHLTLLYFYLLLLGQMNGQYIKRFINILVLNGVLLTIFGYLGKLSFNADYGAKNLPSTLVLDPLSPGTLFFSQILDPSLPVRVSSTFGNPIFFASFLIVPLCFSGYLFFNEETKWKKIWYAFAFLISLVGVLQSGTRGALVGIIIGGFLALVCFIVFSKNSKIRIYGGLTLVIFVLLFSSGFYFKDQLPQNSGLKRIFSLRDANSTSRLLQWKVALNGYKDNPVFGTGAENYFIIANKYYDPEIYKYDPSWFDKPHNYWLEILTANGAVGFLAYLGIFLASIFALYKGFKQEFLSLSESVVLLGGVVAYQVQNIFVFDTVSTSTVFIIITAFCGYIYRESLLENLKKTNIKKDRSLIAMYADKIFIVIFMFVLYSNYLWNIIPMTVAKDVNYGYAYSSVDGKKSLEYFTSAEDSYFNFDKLETFSRKTELVNASFGGKNKVTQEEAFKILDQTIKQGEELVKTNPQSPILLQQLANLYINKSFFTKTALDVKALTAINEAKKLAPKRIEPLISAMQVALLQNDADTAISLAKKIAETNPNPQYKFQLAQVYQQAKKFDLAIEIMENLRQSTYSFSSFDQVAWVLDYYTGKNDLAASVPWYEIAAALKPANLDFYVSMANILFETGRKEEAVGLAKQVLQSNPSLISKLNPALLGN